MFIVVSYDIPDDHRRDKVAKTMEDFGKRVQYSVFECNLEKEQLEKLENRLSKIINIGEDSIRIYILCQSCIGKVKVYGSGEITKDPEVYII